MCDEFCSSFGGCSPCGSLVDGSVLLGSSSLAKCSVISCCCGSRLSLANHRYILPLGVIMRWESLFESRNCSALAIQFNWLLSLLAAMASSGMPKKSISSRDKQRQKPACSFNDSTLAKMPPEYSSFRSAALLWISPFLVSHMSHDISQRRLISCETQCLLVSCPPILRL